MPKTNPVRRGAPDAPAGEAIPAVKSIARAVSVLSCLGEGLNTLTDIAARCRLTKSTVHRILRALEDAGLAAQYRPDHRYYLGPFMARLVTSPQITHGDLVSCALGQMRRLSGLFGENVNLCVMPALENLTVHEIGGTFDLTVAPDAARVGTPFAGALFRMQLAQLSEARLRAVMKYFFANETQAFARLGREEFLKKVEEARRQGYTVSIEEKLPGVIGVAAPIRGYTCPAVIGVVGPEHRMRARTGEVIREVVASVREVSRSVGRSVTGADTAPASQ